MSEAQLLPLRSTHPRHPHRRVADSHPGPARRVATSEVRVELGTRHTQTGVEADLAANPTHWLTQFDPSVATTVDGRTEIRLTMYGADAWTSTVTALAVLRQSGYALRALHVESTDAGTAHRRPRPPATSSPDRAAPTHSRTAELRPPTGPSFAAIHAAAARAAEAVAEPAREGEDHMRA